MRSDGRLKGGLYSKPARKCSPLFSLKHPLTERHIQMLAALAQQRALTRDQLTAVFFGSKRRCQAALALLKQLGLIRHVIYLPQPLAGAGPRAYILTAEGARVAAQVTGSRLRWADRPTPGFWATTTALLAANGPLGPVWARLPGNGERVPLLDLAA